MIDTEAVSYTHLDVYKRQGKNAELLKMFDEGLKNIKASGEYQKILDKYIANK